MDNAMGVHGPQQKLYGALLRIVATDEPLQVAQRLDTGFLGGYQLTSVLSFGLLILFVASAFILLVFNRANTVDDPQKLLFHLVVSFSLSLFFFFFSFFLFSTTG